MTDTEARYTPSEQLDSSGETYTWEELTALLSHWRTQCHSDTDLPTSLRDLADGRIVDDDWDPATDADPFVWATETVSCRRHECLT